MVSVMLRDRVWLLSQVDQTHLFHILFLRIWIFRLLISESQWESIVQNSKFGRVKNLVNFKRKKNEYSVDLVSSLSWNFLMRGIREVTQSGFITFSGWPNAFTSYTFPQNLDISSLHFRIVIKVECAKSQIFFAPKSLLISNLKKVDILLIRFFHFLENF